MSIPIEAYRPLLVDESIAIAAMERTTEFEAIPAIIPQSITAEEAFPVSFTNVHMVPGDTSPRLRKVEERNPGIPPMVADAAVEHCVGYLNATLGVLHEDHMRMAARAIGQVCEEVDKEAASPLGAPFKTLAVLAVYVTHEGEPFATEFGSRHFAETLVGHMPELDVDLSKPEEIDDEILKMAYDLQSEHQDLGPYERWKQESIENIRVAREYIGDTEQARALGYMEHLILPPAITHPTINKVLF